MMGLYVGGRMMCIVIATNRDGERERKKERKKERNHEQSLCYLAFETNIAKRVSRVIFPPRCLPEPSR